MKNIFLQSLNIFNNIHNTFKSILNISYKNNKILLVLIVSYFLTSCYSDTIQNFSQFTIQLPVYFYDNSNNRKVPSIGYDFTNMYKYDEFKNNKDRIDRAEVYQFSYWIDSLVFPNTLKPFDPKSDEIIFDRIKYTLVFAKPKNPSLSQSLDPNDFMIDSLYQPFVIGDFQNVKISEYYKSPKHIITIPEKDAIVFSNVLKSQPYFYIVSEYSKYQGQTQDTIYFPYLKIHSDLVIRLTVKL